MKSKIAGVVSAALLIAPVSVFAQGVTCAPTDHPVYAADSVTITSCISDAAWEAAMAAQSSRAANHLPVVAVGARVTDDAGIQYVCLPGVPRYDPGCYDLTHTAEYEAQARLIAQELGGGFGWGYWLNH